jgi:biopolymer transport protein ExbD
MQGVDFNSKNRFKVMADINMIPFIDVSLVLLIIFMVMTPFLVKLQERDIRVEPPATRSTGPITEMPNEIVVNVNTDGRFVVGGELCGLEEVDRIIKSKVAENPRQVVVIRGDRDSLLQYAVTILDLCERARVERTYLTTRPTDR